MWSTLEADEINECQPDFSQLLERFHAQNELRIPLVDIMGSNSTCGNEGKTMKCQFKKSEARKVGHFFARLDDASGTSKGHK